MRRITNPREAAHALADGHLVGLPTETVYGLGGLAGSAEAVARIYAAKGRPADHPLIVHVCDAAAAWHWARKVPAAARQLADAYWPGPMTLVLERSPRAEDFITGMQDTVAIRVPSHPAMQQVLRELVRITGDEAIGIAAPSANRFGRVSPTTAQHVLDELDEVTTDDDLVLDGGASEVGVESTIVDCSTGEPILLRPGRVSAQDIEQATGMSVGTHSKVRAPGMLESHYAPRAKVVVTESTTTEPDEGTGAGTLNPTGPPTTGLLALAAITTPPGVVRLSAPETADDYARVLYSSLREADALHLHTILAIPPSPDGIGDAVIDRLQRAAAGN